MIDFAFAHIGFEKLEAYHRLANKQSGRVLEKAVMRRPDTVESFARARVMPKDEICYCVERDTQP